MQADAKQLTKNSGLLKSRSQRLRNAINKSSNRNDSEVTGVIDRNNRRHAGRRLSHWEMSDPSGTFCPVAYSTRVPAAGMQHATHEFFPANTRTSGSHPRHVPLFRFVKEVRLIALQVYFCKCGLVTYKRPFHRLCNLQMQAVLQRLLACEPALLKQFPPF